MALLPLERTRENSNTFRKCRSTMFRVLHAAQHEHLAAHGPRRPLEVEWLAERAGYHAGEPGPQIRTTVEGVRWQRREGAGSQSGGNLPSEAFERSIQRGRERPAGGKVGRLHGVAVHVGRDTGTESPATHGEGGAAGSTDRNGTHAGLAHHVGQV